MVKLFEGASRDKPYVMKASALALLFWLAQFAYQYYFAVSGLMDSAIIRGFALSGATLISVALIIGPMARLSKYNFLYHRRTFGVWGFTFLIMHALSVMYFYFSFDFALLQQEPTFTIILFGIIAFLLYLPMYLTSTDWAAEKLGFRRWKIIHRLVYFAYIFSVLHYTRLGGNSAPKIFLLIVTVIALALQLAAFFKTIYKTKNRKDLIIGLLIIFFGLALFYAAFVMKLF